MSKEIIFIEISQLKVFGDADIFSFRQSEQERSTVTLVLESFDIGSSDGFGHIRWDQFVARVTISSQLWIFIARCQVVMITG